MWVISSDEHSDVIYVSFQNEAKGDLYLDDGQSYDYRKKRQFLYRRFTFKNNQLQST